MPERVLDALSAAANAQPFIHLVDGILPCMPDQPQSDAVRVPRELLERVVKPVLFMSQEDSHYDACTELRALLGGDHDPAL